MIIDSHIHLYDPERPQGIPWPPPDNRPLYRRVLPEHVKAAVTPEGVTGIVVIEASPWVEDNAWVLDLAEKDPFIVGFSGNLDPESPDFGHNLRRFASNSLFRGIRVGGKRIQKPAVRTALEQLLDHNLELDLLIGPEELPHVATLAAQLPDLHIVLNHVVRTPINGKPPAPAWVEHIRNAAAHPRVYCKVSALVQLAADRPAPDDLAYYVPILDALWDAFGDDRLLYGSDWPVCESAAPYATVIRLVRQYVESRGPDAAEKYFWKNARAAYQWTRRNGSN